MITLCITLLPKDRVHAIAAYIGKKFKPIPVIDRARIRRCSNKNNRVFRFYNCV